MSNLLVGLVVVAVLALRQLRARRTRETSSLRVTLVLGAVGLVEVAQDLHHHSVAVGALVLEVVGLVLAAALGAARAATVRVWRAPDGAGWQQGSWLTVLLWAASIGSHVALGAAERGFDGAAGLQGAAVLLFIATSLGVQRELVRARAARLGERAAPVGRGGGA